MTTIAQEINTETFSISCPEGEGNTELYSKHSIYHISKNGEKFLTDITRPYEMWSQEDIIEAVREIKWNDPDAEPVSIFSLTSLSKDSLADLALARVEWHHVNGKPCCYYTLDIQKICEFSQKDIHKMTMFDKTMRCAETKPKLVTVMLFRWTRSTTGHEVLKRKYIEGVLYGGYVYLPNGKRYQPGKDTCEIVQIKEKTPKKKKELYNMIREKVIRSYGLHC